MVARSRAANQSHASPIGSILPGFGKVEVFSLPEARRVARFDAAKHPGDLRFLDDAQLWATFEHGRRHFSWDVQKSALLWQQGFPESTSFARVDDRLVHLSRRGKKQFELGTLELRSGRRGKPLVIRQELDDMAAVNRDLAVVGGGGKLTAYDLGTMKPVASATLDAEQIRLQAHRPGGVRVTLHPRGQSGPVARVWNPSSGELLPYEAPAVAMPTAVSGPVLAQAATGSLAYLKDLDTLVVRSPEGHERQLVRARPADLNGVAIGPDGTGLAVGDDRGIRLLSFRAPTLGWLGVRGLPAVRGESADRAAPGLHALDRGLMVPRFSPPPARTTLAPLLTVRSCAIWKTQTSVALPFSVTSVGTSTPVPHL